MIPAPNAGLRLLCIGVLVSGATLAVLLAAACGFQSGATTELVGPDFGQFVGILPDGGQGTGVCQVLQNRCATLDCHGQISRPLRIYGANGLRLTDGGSEDAENVPGQEPTTEAEYRADYEAVIGLQPEGLMTEVVQGSQPPTSLLLLRKPLQLERHKGGAVIGQGDPAYVCLTTWLTASPEAGPIDYAKCATASTQ